MFGSVEVVAAAATILIGRAVGRKSFGGDRQLVTSGSLDGTTGNASCSSALNRFTSSLQYSHSLHFPPNTDGITCGSLEPYPQAKIQDLHQQIEELTQKVGNLQTENAALHSRTSILEKVLDMRNEQIQVMQESKEVSCKD